MERVSREIRNHANITIHDARFAVSLTLEAIGHAELIVTGASLLEELDTFDLPVRAIKAADAFDTALAKARGLEGPIFETDRGKSA